MRKRSFALSIDEYPQTISAITKGKRGINTPLALKIEHALGLEEGYFMTLQVFYDIKEEKRKQQKNIPPNFSLIRRGLFWDTNINKIDWYAKRRAIIERILERGNDQEKEEIKKFYGDIIFQTIASNTATTDKQRIKIVEQFLLSQHKDIHTDKLIVEAVRLIYQTKGTIRIKELNEKLFISQSPFEKRFRKVVGTTPKKFASIVRFNTVLDSFDKTKSLTEICYENGFFDQAHFIKDFKQFTGDTPENFKRFL